MASLSKAQRQKKIMDMLEEKEKIAPEEFSDALDVSMATLRRDFKELKDENRILVGYGFVQSKQNAVHGDANMNKSFLKRLSNHYQRKLKAAENALNYVEEEDLIFIGEGTTCYLFTKLLLREFKRLKVITNGLYALNALSKSKSFEVEGIGGTLLSDFNSFIGPKAEKMVESMYVRKFFFSCGTYKNGTYELSPFTASIKRMVLNRSDQHYLIIDSSKYETVAPFYLAKPEEIDRIITEEG